MAAAAASSSSSSSVSLRISFYFLFVLLLTPLLSRSDVEARPMTQESRPEPTKPQTSFRYRGQTFGYLPKGSPVPPSGPSKRHNSVPNNWVNSQSFWISYSWLSSFFSLIYLASGWEILQGQMGSDQFFVFVLGFVILLVILYRKICWLNYIWFCQSRKWRSVYTGPKSEGHYVCKYVLSLPKLVPLYHFWFNS